MAALTHVCGWCGRVLTDTADNKADAGLTHGICPDCVDRHFADQEGDNSIDRAKVNLCGRTQAIYGTTTWVWWAINEFRNNQEALEELWRLVAARRLEEMVDGCPAMCGAAT